MAKGYEPAFPVLYGQTNGADGLTKRELFAAMAMQGMLASPHTANSGEQDVAKWSVEFADALLAELNREQDND